MTKSQREILITFKSKRQHVVVDGCADPDCKKEFQQAITALLTLCDEAERESAYKSKEQEYKDYKNR